MPDRNLCNPIDVRYLLSTSGISISSSIDIGDSSPLLLGTGAGSARLAGMIPSSSRQFERETMREFDYNAGEDVVVDGTGTNYLFTPRGKTPIISVSGVKTRGSAYSAGDVRVHNADAGVLRLVEAVIATEADPYGYELGSLRVPIRSRFDFPRFPKGVGNVTVTMSWGFVSGGTYQTPDDVIMAVAKTVAANVLGIESGSDARGGGVESRSISYWSENLGERRWAGLLKGWQENWRQAVDNWRISVR